MRSHHELYRTEPTVYPFELETCPFCAGPLVDWHYVSGPKTVQTLTGPLTIAHRPKRCAAAPGAGAAKAWRSAAWQQIAPPHCTSGYDVIVQIGWQRQTACARFTDIHATLQPRLQISESEVRSRYHQAYLPLLACHERQERERLRTLADRAGLILACLRQVGAGRGRVRLRRSGAGTPDWADPPEAGWLSSQAESTFVTFLQPIHDLPASGGRVVAVLSDKQRGLVPAVAAVFPAARHAFCQFHYLQNAAAPVAVADESASGGKVALRKDVRDRVGDLIRQEQVAEAPGVLTVTGLVPSPLAPPAPAVCLRQTSPNRGQRWGSRRHPPRRQPA